jgi:uncharacterized protein with ParB-like and HNH nuclease domain
MSSNLRLDTNIRRFSFYLDELKKGNIQIPAFQRDFIWEVSDIIDLFESIKKSYPIGSFLFWKPDTRFNINDELGPWKLLDNKKIELASNNNCQYVLDGFQRLSSLFGCLTNPKDENIHFGLNEQLYKQKFALCYNLRSENFEIPRGSDNDRPFYVIPVYAFVDTFEFLTYASTIRSSVSNEDEFLTLLERAQTISKTFLEYYIPYIEIKGGEFEEAVTIFTKLNQSGKKISPDWIVSARTNTENFRFGTEIDDLLVDLKEYNFEDRGKENIIRELVFRCIQSSFGDFYLKVNVENLIKKPNFQEVSLKSIISIKKAVKFLYEDLLVIDGKLLPARAQLIFITEFFNQIEEPNEQQLNELKNWFWITSYSNYFTIYSPSKRSEAFDWFRKDLENPDQLVIRIYNDSPDVPFKIPEIPQKINFGSVRAKTLMLFLLNHVNDFNQVNSEEIEGLKLFNLFSKQDHKGNLIPLIEFIDQTNEKNKVPTIKVKDLSNWLDSDVDYSKFFITNELKTFYQGGMLPNEAVLNNRLELIIEAEKIFVSQFNILQY